MNTVGFLLWNFIKGAVIGLCLFVAFMLIVNGIMAIAEAAEPTQSQRVQEATIGQQDRSLRVYVREYDNSRFLDDMDAIARSADFSRSSSSSGSRSDDIRERIADIVNE